MLLCSVSEVEPAPHPEDIVWENLSFSRAKRVLVQVSGNVNDSRYLQIIPFVMTGYVLRNFTRKKNTNYRLFELQALLWVVALGLCTASFCIAAMLIILNISLKNKDFTGVRQLALSQKR